MKTMTFRFDDEYAAIIDADAETAGSATAAVMQLFTDGLRLRMEQNDPPIHRHFLDTLTPAGVVEFYGHFIAAVRFHAGLEDSPRHWHFEQVPPGGKWEAAGMTGAWTVIGDLQRLTPDGIELMVDRG